LLPCSLNGDAGVSATKPQRTATAAAYGVSLILETTHRARPIFMRMKNSVARGVDQS
jgi:hypothetical protein